MKRLLNISWLFIPLSLVLLSACSEQEQSSSVVPLQPVQVESTAKVLFEEVVPFHAAELDGEALAVWRQYAAQKPTMLLLSNDPMLARVPGPVWPEASHTITVGKREEIVRIVNSQLAAPLLMPSMTLEAALRSGWIGQLAWALPLQDVAQKLSVENFSKQLLTSGLIDEAEVASLNGTEKVLRGEVRGIPLVASALPHLPELTGPVIVHIDQSYFQKLYKNEIATPIVTLVINTLSRLREQRALYFPVSRHCAMLLCC